MSSSVRKKRRIIENTKRAKKDSRKVQKTSFRKTDRIQETTLGEKRLKLIQKKLKDMLDVRKQKTKIFRIKQKKIQRNKTRFYKKPEKILR